MSMRTVEMSTHTNSFSEYSRGKVKFNPKALSLF